MRHGSHMTRVKHLTDHSMTSKYTPDMSSCYPGFQKEEPDQYTSSVIWWSKEDDTVMNMLSLCFMSVIWGIDHVQHVWITLHTTSWPQTAPQICSAVTLVLGSKSLNHAPHQCCSGQRIMMHVLICYPTVPWELYYTHKTAGLYIHTFIMILGPL